MTGRDKEIIYGKNKNKRAVQKTDQTVVCGCYAVGTLLFVRSHLDWIL